MAVTKQWGDPISTLCDSTHDLPAQKRFDAIGHKLVPNPSPFNRIQHFSQAVLSGALPDVETLRFVVTSLFKYEQRAGSISLDEAFGLKSKPKAGNPARQYSQNNRLQDLLCRVAAIRVDNPELTLNAAAIRVLGRDKTFPVETLLRAYRRGGIGKVWEKALRGK